MKGCDELLGLQDTLKALADPIRREILNLLKGGRLSAGEICEHFSVTGASISRHLAILKDAELIRSRREGKFIYYELNTSVLEDVMLWITDLRGGYRTMKEMIKKYKGTLICSVLVMLAGILVGFTMAQSIWINVFFVVTDCILVTIIFYDNRNRQQSSKVIGMVIWIIPVTALIYNGMARLISMDADSENLYMAVIYFGTGLLFMIIGNYLPKMKQNNTIGIRVVWTLQDEENWSATHRFSGKLWVASGVLCMLCGLFGESIAALVLYIVSIMAAAIVSILYSYLFYKKKMAAGEKLKIQYNKKTIVIYVIVSVFVVIFTIWTLFWGGIDISFHDNDFTVEAQGWSDYTVDYGQIDSISYKENLFQNGHDRRTNGMGNLKYGMGNFRNDIYGDYIRYTHASCHSYVVMDIGGKILVVNGADDSETKRIYDTLIEKCQMN